MKLLFPGGKLPPVFEFSISALCCKNLIASSDDGCYYLYMFHNDCSVMYS